MHANLWYEHTINTHRLRIPMQIQRKHMCFFRPSSFCQPPNQVRDNSYNEPQTPATQYHKSPQLSLNIMTATIQNSMGLPNLWERTPQALLPWVSVWYKRKPQIRTSLSASVVSWPNITTASKKIFRAESVNKWICESQKSYYFILKQWRKIGVWNTKLKQRRGGQCLVLSGKGELLQSESHSSFHFMVRYWVYKDT